ncbi:dehydrogenase-like [Tropilaelaps mercedesae]|uniref:Dehydrogenase-like n=1 Tax=Tropilaelaps mercedesae TaxID=418985 RepID=A0A1V9XYW7_9ACAR|nr:dehydrogenase-like [Tropilaelaps mercedesae]
MLLEVRLTVETPVSECAVDVQQQLQQKIDERAEDLGVDVTQSDRAETLNGIECLLTKSELSAERQVSVDQIEDNVETVCGNNNDENNSDNNSVSDSSINVKLRRKHLTMSVAKKIRNSTRGNMYRQVFIYLCVPIVLCTLFMVPIAQYALLYISATIGLFTLWFSIGWYLIYYVMPSGKLSSEGKAVFITGCDSGFGYKLALKLDCEGYQVFAGCLFPNGEGAHQLRNSASNRLCIVGIDVTKDQDFTLARDFIRENLSGNVLWAVVANAGIFDFMEFEWFTSTEISRTLDVNVLGVSRTVLAFLPLLRESRGRLVIISSYAGRMTPVWHTVYSMSKHALIALADGLRKELYKFDVAVITIEPFYFRTPILPLSDVIYDRFRRNQNPEIKAVFTEEYARTEAYSQIAFMDILARENTDEVVDTMAKAISTQYPMNNYSVDGFFNWALCQVLIFSPSIVYDWADHLAHGRWSRGFNDNLIRRRSAYEHLFGKWQIPDATLEKNSH